MLASLLLIGVMAQRYAALVSERSAWIEACLAEPASCAGRRVFLSLVEVVEVGEGSYTVRKVTQDIPIRGDVRQRRVGQTISVVATFDPEVGALVEQAPKAHPLRKQKRQLGVLGVLLAGAAALGSFTAGRGGLRLRG
ncbi:MAG: hypothetical protein H6741_13245 [Alphaproteobacteria bacterium]|nr:hypothetical protein [Alphaproteobacteria bacterium]